MDLPITSFQRNLRILMDVLPLVPQPSEELAQISGVSVSRVQATLSTGNHELFHDPWDELWEVTNNYDSTYTIEHLQAGRHKLLYRVVLSERELANYPIQSIPRAGEDVILLQGPDPLGISIFRSKIDGRSLDVRFFNLQGKEI